jgi:UTP:GlnB (protein PII) uridylyltransferase
LTESDSLATGPAAWGSWQAELVGELVARVRHVLGGGDAAEVTWRLFPDADTLARMAVGAVDVRREADPSRSCRRTAPGRSAESQVCCRCTAST